MYLNECCLPNDSLCIGYYIEVSASCFFIRDLLQPLLLLWRNERCKDVLVRVYKLFWIQFLRLPMVIHINRKFWCYPSVNVIWKNVVIWIWIVAINIVRQDQAYFTRLTCLAFALRSFIIFSLCLTLWVSTYSRLI